jgi:iron complex outermembrane receptor protein
MANIAFFYMDISSAQVEESVSLVEEYLTNAGRAKSMGVELDMTAVGHGRAHPKRRVRLYRRAIHQFFGQRRRLQRQQAAVYAPEYTVNIGAQYRAQNGFYVRGDVVGYGKTYFDKKNTGYRDPYALVNAKIGFERDRYDIYVYGKNIFDCRHDIKKWNGMDVYSDPGEMGVQVVFRF